MGHTSLVQTQVLSVLLPFTLLIIASCYPFMSKCLLNSWFSPKAYLITSIFYVLNKDKP